VTRRLVRLVEGNEVVAAVGAAAVLGVVVGLVPALDRVLLLVVSTGLVVLVGALVVWLLRSHREVEWTTSSGTPGRVRGSDRRVTVLARTIDAAVAGDEPARRDLQSLVRSAAEAALGAKGLSPDLGNDASRAALGPALTAYLTATTARPVAPDELSAFITTLEEH